MGASTTSSTAAERVVRPAGRLGRTRGALLAVLAAPALAVAVGSLPVGALGAGGAEESGVRAASATASATESDTPGRPVNGWQ